MWKAYQTLSSCQNFPIPTGQSSCQKNNSNWSASKAWHVLITKPQSFNKTASCSHHCPLRHPAPSLGHHRHPASSLGHRYTGVYLRIFDPGPSNPSTFLGFCSPGDYRQSIQSPIGVPTFNSTENALTFTIYDCILRIWPPKVFYLTKVSPLDVELI